MHPEVPATVCCTQHTSFSAWLYVAAFDLLLDTDSECIDGNL